MTSIDLNCGIRLLTRCQAVATFGGRLLVCVGLYLAFAANTAMAQAHSDVFFTYGETKIEIQEQEGRRVIPQVLPESGFFAQANSNPGFFSESDVGGGTGANDVVVYNVLDDLVFWSDGGFSDPSAETGIRIVNNPRTVEDTIIGAATGVQRASFSPLSNSIGQSSSSGEFHTHIDFQLEPRPDDPENMPLFGAYGLKLSLSSDSEIEESDPFFVVFRFGIDDELFEMALDDFDSLLEVAPGLLGDFDADSMLTAIDIDLLSAEVSSESNSVACDVNSDGLVDGLDRTTWIQELAGTQLGDADLNGSVDFADFLALSNSFGGDGGWAAGDFDGNGSVAFADFLALSDNFGTSASAEVSAVPEPSACWLFILGLAVMSRFRKRVALISIHV